VSEDHYVWKPRRLGVLLVLTCAAAALVSYSARAQETPPDPRLLNELGIMTVVTGLDARNNQIDALLSKFGTSCSTEPPWDTRPCAIEKELWAFLRSLPASQDAIATKLAGLGAACRKELARLDCVYERHAHYVGWVAGYDGPAGTSDDFFRITFTVTNSNGVLDYGVEFRRNIGREPPQRQ
jgi:hypothetical protein